MRGQKMTSGKCGCVSGVFNKLHLVYQDQVEFITTTCKKKVQKNLSRGGTTNPTKISAKADTAPKPSQTTRRCL